jgi:hypothetical protein
MRRAKSVFCLGLLFLFLGIAAGIALGEDGANQAAWNNLKQLSAGQEIQVVQDGAKSSRGSYRSFTDDAIVMSTAGGEQTISRQGVVRVSSKGKRHRMRNALIGAGVGAGAGLGIGAGLDSADKCANCLKILPNGGKEIATPLGAIAGAIVGAVIPSGGWHEIYRAR